MKLKTHKVCGDCASCVEIFHDGRFYCNMKANDLEHSKMDISTCKVDPETKPEDCPWDKVCVCVDSFSREDQLGIKCLVKMFGGENTESWFEDEPAEWENAGCGDIRCPVCKSEFSDELFFMGKGTGDRQDIRHCPGCGTELSSGKYFD